MAAKWPLNISRFNSNVEELQNNLLIASIIKVTGKFAREGLSVNEGIFFFFYKTLIFKSPTYLQDQIVQIVYI